MTTPDAPATIREQAIAAGKALLETPDWEPVAPRTLLMLVRPPALEWVEAPTAAALWAILDAPEARALPTDWSLPLTKQGATVENLPADATAPAIELSVFTSEAIATLIDGITRRSVELRWLARHGQPVHDPMHRFEMLVGAASRLPGDGLERVARPLFVQAVQAFDALATLPAEGSAETLLLVAGEAAASVCRLACVIEDGSHPPTEWLMPATRETRLGGRIRSWLDDLTAAVSGDARAARWIRDSGSGVLREVHSALRPEFGGRDWLADPQAHAIRPTR